ncbi:FAD-dependent oxidoreductase [Actinopolymorpha pittospori]|uniref:Thioredoxin reductase (NADPH) n=1 Tax=Actinopolymorpha pittospori TaxID=648752 RepID=A0A927RDW6_9ACTN|nr:thioredoxin reductase (NADPH) [Actinopolymorpha pittospori]
MRDAEPSGGEDVDVVVIGGSFAGLQAALTLGRACRRVVVLDDGRPRNARASHVHNFLGHHDPAPAVLQEAARTHVGDYDVSLESDRVARVEPAATDRLTVTSQDGRTWQTRALLLATGLDDELPDVPGVSDLWGEDVVACPHCHGWEVRDEPLAQLGFRGMPARGVERALLLSRWSQDVVLLTDGDELDTTHHARLRAAGVTVDTRRVRRLVHEDGRLQTVEFAEGTALPRRAVFVVTRQHQQTDLARLLGCDHVEDGPAACAVVTDAKGRTSVRGVWAAGTTTQPALLAIGAAGHASTVAVALNNDLLEQDLQAATSAADRVRP